MKNVLCVDYVDNRMKRFIDINEDVANIFRHRIDHTVRGKWYILHVDEYINMIKFYKSLGLIHQQDRSWWRYLGRKLI